MTETTITREEVRKICTRCGREGHWAQEHELAEAFL